MSCNNTIVRTVVTVTKHITQRVIEKSEQLEDPDMLMLFMTIFAALFILITILVCCCGLLRDLLKSEKDEKNDEAVDEDTKSDYFP